MAQLRFILQIEGIMFGNDTGETVLAHGKGTDVSQVPIITRGWGSIPSINIQVSNNNEA